MSSTVAATVRTARIRQIQKYMKIHDEEFDANLHRLGSLLHNISNKAIGVNRAMSKVGYTSQFWGKLIILNEGTCPHVPWISFRYAYDCCYKPENGKNVLNCETWWQSYSNVQCPKNYVILYY